MGLSLKELNTTLENMKNNPQSAGIPLASDTKAGLLSSEQKKAIDGLVNHQYTFNDTPDTGLTESPDIIGMINQAFTNAKSVNSSLSSISNKINNINTGGINSTPVGTATVDDVLSTVTFSSATAGSGKTGNIKVYNSTEGSAIISDSTNTILPLPEQSVAFKVPKGYYDGTAVLGVGDDNFKKSNIVAGTTIFGLAGEYIGTTTTTLPVLNNQADENCILSGKSAYRSTGATTSVVGGNIPVISDSTSMVIDAATISTPLSLFGDTVGLDIIPPRGYYDGVVHLDIKDLNFKAENIKAGVTIFGVQGIAAAQVDDWGTWTQSRPNRMTSVVTNAGKTYWFIMNEDINGFSLASTVKVYNSSGVEIETKTTDFLGPLNSSSNVQYSPIYAKYMNETYAFVKGDAKYVDQGQYWGDDAWFYNYSTNSASRTTVGEFACSSNGTLYAIYDKQNSILRRLDPNSPNVILQSVNLNNGTYTVHGIIPYNGNVLILEYGSPGQIYLKEYNSSLNLVSEHSFSSQGVDEDILCTDALTNSVYTYDGGSTIIYRYDMITKIVSTADVSNQFSDLDGSTKIYSLYPGTDYLYARLSHSAGAYVTSYKVVAYDKKTLAFVKRVPYYINNTLFGFYEDETDIIKPL